MNIDEIKRHLTTPTNMPVHSLRGARPHKREVFRVSYETTREAARALLPEPLQVPESPQASIVATRFFGLYGEEPHLAIQQCIEAEFDGVVGDYVVAVYTDSVEAIMISRDLFIEPIVAGRPALTGAGGASLMTLGIGAERVMGASAPYKASPSSMADGEAFLMRPKFYLKLNHDPFVGSHKHAHLHQVVPESVELEEAFESLARLYFVDHIMAPLNDLPILRTLGARHAVATFHPGAPRVIHAYDYE